MKQCTAWKVSKYGVLSGPYFPTFGLNTERYLRITPYSVRMRENTDQKKLRIWTLFTQWCLWCLWCKNTKISISRERNILFSSNKKIHLLHIKGYFIAKNSFVAEVIFNSNRAWLFEGSFFRRSHFDFPLINILRKISLMVI